eukprot:UN10716
MWNVIDFVKLRCTTHLLMCISSSCF